MGGGLGTILKDIVSFGGYSQQKKAQEQASNAQRNAEMEARRIAASGKPMEETATLGLDTQTDTLSQLGLTINPDLEKKKKSALGGVAETGLGSGGVTGALGFGS